LLITNLFSIALADCDHLKPFAARVFDGDQEVGTSLSEVEEKGLMLLIASGCTVDFQ